MKQRANKENFLVFSRELSFPANQDFWNRYAHLEGDLSVNFNGGGRNNLNKDHYII